jgi:hypothetical protein
VAQPVSNHLGLVSNSESMFILRDADYDPDVTPSGAIEDSIGQVAGTNGRLIVVQTIRAVVRVEVGVESWHQKPQLDDTPWESQRELALHSHSGVISVGQLYSAPPAELANIPLSAGPGDYAVQVNMRGRERLGRLITELREHDAGLTIAQRAEQEQQLHGVEKYRIRIWPDDQPD